MPEEEREQFGEEQEYEGINLFDYLIVLARRKKLIISITLSAAIILIIIAISSQTTFYVAYTSILPPQSKQPRFASQFLDRLGLGSLGGSTGETHWDQRLLVEIIKSKTVSDRLIDRFNLKALNNADGNYEKVTKLFWENVYIDPSFDNTQGFSLNRRNDSPFINITVTNQNPEKAAEIANAIVEEMQVFIKNIAISEASQRSLFFKEHLRQAHDTLIKTEEDMKAFQEKTGIFAVEGKINITVNKFAPALILEYKRVLRELKFNEALYEIMLKQYEAAKIDEAKDATIIQIIDKAVPPKKPTRMRTWGLKKSLGLTILAFLFSCFMAFFIEFLERSSQKGENRESMETLRNYLSFKK